jgi:hypothetical protein
LQSAATISLNVRYTLGSPVDKVVVKGSFTANGNLILTKIDGTNTFTIGTELQLFDFQGTVSGQFASVTLDSPGAGLTWDTADLLTTGKIKVVEDPTGISSTESNVLQIYPNPATDYIFIELPVTGKAKVEILGITGNVVKSGEITLPDRMDVTELPEGFYLLRIAAGSKTYLAKIVKE